MTLPVVDIFTDGACRGNPGPGGYAALLRCGAVEKVLTGHDPLTTNNRMELMAVLKALLSINKPCHIHLYSDSQYVRLGITTWIETWKRNGWKTSAKQSVKNQDLWVALDAARQNKTIQWHWVKGHDNHPENERVDALAREASVRP